jgi:hypothetical protein
VGSAGSAATLSGIPEKQGPESLATLPRKIHKLFKYAVAVKRLQEWIGDEVGITEEAAFDTAAQQPQRGCLVSQRGVGLAYLINAFGVCNARALPISA